MPGSSIGLISVIIVNLRPVFHKFGLDFDACALDAGLPAEALTNGDLMVDLGSVAIMLDKAAKATGERCFGLRCAQDYPIDVVSLLGFIITNAPTTHDALKAMQRYLRLVIAPVYTSSRTQEGLYYWTISFPRDFTAPRLHLDLFILGMLIRRLAFAAGPGWQLEQLDLPHDDPGCPDLAGQLLARHVSYNQSQMTLVLDVGSLAQKFSSADSRLYNILKQHAENLLKQTPDQSDLVEMTRHQIKLLLSHETVDLEVVAEDLMISPRALQQKLARQNTSFTAIMEDVRSELARYYLKETNMRMTEIAYLLGFSQTSAFTRAAPRWLGMAPQAFRRSIGKSASLSSGP